MDVIQCLKGQAGVNALTAEGIPGGLHGKCGDYITTTVTGNESENDGIAAVTFSVKMSNLPPTSDAGGPYTVNEGGSVRLDGTGSSDPNEDPLTYDWDLDNNGSFDTLGNNSPIFSAALLDGPSYRTVRLRVTDDGLLTDIDEATVTILNVLPTVTASGGIIDENSVATVSGTITDPGSLDTFTVVINWGEGSPVSYSYPAGTTGYSETHQYLDDNPTDTARDIYPIAVTITDDDGGSGIASTTIEVDNVNPVPSIDHITDDTGEEVGTGVRVVLTLLEIDLLGSFTDLGTQDTHTATIAWDDGSSDDLGVTIWAVSHSHIYENPGVYTVLLEVTDDDTGVGPVSSSITVVDASGATNELINQLTALAADPSLNATTAAAINDALAQLAGEDDGIGANGVLDMLAKDNLNPALVKIRQVLQSLEAAEAAAATLDLTSIKSLLSLTAKSVAVNHITEAEVAATKQNQLNKIAEAHDLVDQGNSLLAATDYVGAVETYRDAVQEVQGIVS